MKWRVIIKEPRCAVLECYHAGVLTNNRLCSWCDNYPYVGGTIEMDGIEVGLSFKLSAINAYGGVPMGVFASDERESQRLFTTLPARIPVYMPSIRDDASLCDIEEGRVTYCKSEDWPQGITLEELKAQFDDVACWVSDPRIVLLSYYVSTDRDPGLWKRLAETVTSWREARKVLKQSGLYSPFRLHPSLGDFYDRYHAFLESAMVQFAPEKREIAVAVDEALPNLPVQTIKVAGVFAIDDKAEVLSALKKSIWQRGRVAVTLVREPENKHDTNAIRVDVTLATGEHKLGYLPKDLAADYAPLMDKGRLLNGAIVKVDGEKIYLEPVIRKGTTLPTHLAIVWGEIDRNWYEAELSFAERKLAYRRREHYFSGECMEMTLYFTPKMWETWALPQLKACAFMEWQKTYREVNMKYKFELWRVVARDDRGERRSYGCDCFPVEWPRWLDFIESCLNFNTAKGEATITVRELWP